MVRRCRRGWQAPSVPSGHVVATDIDTGWLGDVGTAFEVRTHDVANDEPPSEGFDLAHARLVLVHVPGREAGLRNMVSALRPGGWIVLEDFDTALVTLACPEELDAGRATREQDPSRLPASCSANGAWIAEYGRKLPRLLREAGLEAVDADAYFPVANPAGRLLEQANTAQVADGLRRHGAGDPRRDQRPPRVACSRASSTSSLRLSFPHGAASPDGALSDPGSSRPARLASTRPCAVHEPSRGRTRPSRRELPPAAVKTSRRRSRSRSASSPGCGSSGPISSASSFGGHPFPTRSRRDGQLRTFAEVVELGRSVGHEREHLCACGRVRASRQR